ncbi:DinB family protein [Sphingobacterium paludis]|uniref:DinB family protein n=2 Tax=Sphingobacterium paludis TaxID=1476465 RepID=A0A4V3E269_9SPHI|nr:DinB family protein [Sphingobacterium paludis]
MYLAICLSLALAISSNCTLAGTIRKNTTEPAQNAARKSGSIDSLIQYFEETTKNLKAQVEGLSAAQLAFKPSPEQWSIGECLEHIILSETMLFEMAKKELAKAPQPERKAEVKVNDENLKHMMGDRSQKFKAPAELQPTGKYTAVKVALQDFTAARKPVLAFIKQANEEDLKNHISEYPTGTVNGHQNLLFIAAHCARHTKQIEEIKANPKFPKK